MVKKCGVMWVIGLCVFLASCRGDGAPILTEAEQLPQHVGQVVSLRGAVALARVPTLLGVDVDAANLKDGQMAIATGRLEKSVVTMVEIQERTRKEGAFAHRGPGTFFRLMDPKTSQLARAKAVQ